MTDPDLDRDDVLGYRGRRVVVTGSSSGIGRSAAELLVALGAEVHGVDVQPPAEESAVAHHGTDLADPASIEATVAAIGGAVDALFNCAGVPGTAPPRTVLAVNYAGLRHLTERLLPTMPAGSAVCSVGSTAAVNWTYHVDELLEVVTLDDFTQGLDELEARLDHLGYPYDVSKEAVNAYTAWRSVSANDLGIRLNCVNPGGTRTPASREFTKAVTAKRFGAEMIEHWPTLLGRMARPDEQAWPMLFLNSPRASFVNGATPFVDAGLTAGLFTGQHHPNVAAGMFWRPPRPRDDA